MKLYVEVLGDVSDFPDALQRIAVAVGEGSPRGVGSFKLASFSYEMFGVKVEDERLPFDTPLVDDDDWEGSFGLSFEDDGFFDNGSDEVSTFDELMEQGYR